MRTGTSFSGRLEKEPARDLRFAVTWLTQAGLATRVRRVTKPGVPLSAYADGPAFKLFLLVVGLLGAMAGTSEKDETGGNSLLTEFNGALAEQYVCQQLVDDCGLSPYYWFAENSRGETDFLVQVDGETYPIEVKAEDSFARRASGRSPRRTLRCNR